MSFVKLQFRPGIYREGTNYSAKGGWFDCDKIRFRNGFPETIGGWQKALTTQITGTARAIHAWSSLSGTIYAAIGTNAKLYVFNTGTIVDITPIRETATLTNPFTTVISTATVTVTDASHGASVGDYVAISGASTVNGVTAAMLNTTHRIVTVPTANTYTITVSGNASGSGSGGGTPVTAQYEIHVGLNSTVYGTGFGAGTWGRNTWGSASNTAAEGPVLRLWGMDNWGEDLLANIRNGSIYYWTVGTARAVLLSSMTGATSVPDATGDIEVTSERHAVAFGCTPEAGGGRDPMTIRWSSAEDVFTWNALSTNSAGEYRLSSGSQIMAQIETSQEILVWTDTSLYSMRYVGAPFVYGFTLMAPQITIMGPNAKGAVNDVTYWMGVNRFYRYAGRVEPLECSVQEYIFDRINTAQRDKVLCAVNHSYDEVMWFYPSSSSEEIDSYVTYNYVENAWYYGSLSRTAWLDRGVFRYPLGISDDGYLYYHEFGLNDGSTSPVSAIEAYIESAPVEIDDGYNYMMIRQVLPDLTFRNSNSSSPTATLTLTPRNFPTGSLGSAINDNSVRSATSPIEVSTSELYMRLRARSVILKLSSEQVDTAWRLGVPRLDVRMDGKKT